MRTRTVLGTWLLIAMASAQTPWVLPGNASINPATDYLGSQNNADLLLRTNAISRFRLLPDATYTIGSFAGVKDGSLLLCPKVDQFYSNGAPGPYSLLHLAAADDNAQQDSYRDWMDVGLSLTGNKDHGYIGQKAGETDYTDMIVHWSDNPGENLKDRMRFLFTSGHDALAGSGAQSDEGLEFMRMFPSRYDQPYIGIGDWYAANLVDPTITEPEERLDIVNGRLRIRELPLVANQNETLNKYMVVDDNGVVQWRTIAPGSIGTNSCEWELNPGAFQMATAYRTSTTAAACTDRRWRLGVGISTPVYKVDVYHDESFQTVSGGLRVQLFTGIGGRRGIFCRMSPVGGGSLPDGVAAFHEITGVAGGSTGSIGRVSLNLPNANTLAVGARGDVYTTAGSSDEVIGVSGYARTTNPGTVTNSYGVKGESEGSAGAIGSSYGVYGRATANVGAFNYSIYGESAGTGTNDWAGYFNGRTYVAGTIFTPSDENLKTEIEPLENATERLVQLDPKSYLFRTEEFPSMGLPQEQQYGFMASELQEVFPEMVIETTHPASYDSSGVELTPAIPFKAVSLGGLTPVLVAAFQEQQATIADLNDRLAQMEARLDGCCSGSPSEGRSNATEQGIGNSATIGNDRTLRIVPNPMQDQATIYYQLERSGRMQLLANSADGKELRVLKEANSEAGSYQYAWPTEGLAPGVYYVTLLLDGQPITKQVIKIDR